MGRLLFGDLFLLRIHLTERLLIALSVLPREIARRCPGVG